MLHVNSIFFWLVGIYDSESELQNPDKCHGIRQRLDELIKSRSVHLNRDMD